MGCKQIPMEEDFKSSFPDSFWEPKIKGKRTKADILADRISDLEERIDNSENDGLIEELEKKKEELEKKLDELSGTDNVWYDLLHDQKFIGIYDKWVRFFRDTTDDTVKSILNQASRKGRVSKDQYDYMQYLMTKGDSHRDLYRNPRSRL